MDFGTMQVGLLKRKSKTGIYTLKLAHIMAFLWINLGGLGVFLSVWGVSVTNL